MTLRGSIPAGPSLLAVDTLREVKATELIAADTESYIRVAVRLGTDVAYRHEISKRITDAIASGTTCLSPQVFMAELTNILEKLASAAKDTGAKPPVTFQSMSDVLYSST